MWSPPDASWAGPAEQAVDDLLDRARAQALGGPGATGIVEVGGAKLFFPEERPDELVAALRTFWARA